MIRLRSNCLLIREHEEFSIVLIRWEANGIRELENDYLWNAESQTRWVFEGLKGFQLETLRVYGIRGMWIIFVQISIRDFESLDS